MVRGHIKLFTLQMGEKRSHLGRAAKAGSEDGHSSRQDAVSLMERDLKSGIQEIISGR